MKPRTERHRPTADWPVFAWAPAWIAAGIKRSRVMAPVDAALVVRAGYRAFDSNRSSEAGMNTTGSVGRYGVIALTVAMAATLHTTAAKSGTPGDAQLIASAESAAPAAVAKDATVVAMGADGKMRTLRKGHNGFTCMPDSPATPGPDPMCMDGNAFEWVGAWVAHQPPPPGKFGFMYMLQGGTDASNTDPYATKPAAGNHWIKTGAHVMIVGAGQSFYDMYPKDANPDTSTPYVMWAGTPYQHLMVPVK
jgi:hypothetical protein